MAVNSENSDTVLLRIRQNYERFKVNGIKGGFQRFLEKIPPTLL